MGASQDLATTVWPARIEENDIPNERNIVNRLPLELLAHIFIITGNLEHDPQERICRGPYLAIQDRATQVCRRWREVAIGTRVLWSYIHVTRPPPHQLATLYISRAGTSTLFDINIEVRPRYIGGDDSDPYVSSGYKGAFRKTLDWLINTGAGMDRWRSGSIGASDLKVLAEAFRALAVHSAPALQNLSFHWDCLGPLGPLQIPGHHENTIQSSLSGLPNAPMPHLRSIELVHAPGDLLLRQPMLPVQQLTSLSYKSPVGSFFSVSALAAMIMACPLLESLSFDDSTALCTLPSTHPLKRALLQSLRSLSIKAGDSEAARQTLVMINAPTLHSLALSVTRSSKSLTQRQAGNSPLAHYISSSRMPSNSFDASSTDGPAYPQLGKLDISEVEFSQDDLTEMFSSLSSVTHLVLAKQQAWSLGKEPWPMPELEYLGFPRGAHEQFGEVLRRRSQAGFPIECIGLTSRCETLIGRDLRHWSRVEVIPGVPEVVYDYELGLDDERNAPPSSNPYENLLAGLTDERLLYAINGRTSPTFDYDDLSDPSYEFE